jgi:hypothetical protein
MSGAGREVTGANSVDQTRTPKQAVDSTTKNGHKYADPQSSDRASDLHEPFYRKIAIPAVVAAAPCAMAKPVEP